MAEQRLGDEEIVDVLGDEYSRTILTSARSEPQSVDDLSDACSADPSTVYRRVEQLEEAGLLQEQQELDPNGHHYKVYVTTLREVHVLVEEHGLDVEVKREEETAADRFTRLYEGFK